MNRMSFLVARTFRQEARLASLSCGREALLAELSAKHVALVGNARSLSDAAHGAAIDAADIVIRINRAPMPSPRSHGRRTDWLALATAIGQADLDRIRPGRCLWMSHKRKRLSWAVAASPGFYLHPVGDFERLKSTLRAPPTTGLMMIDLCAASDMASLALYGFDFFASLSLTGRRTADQVPHDFATERAFVDTLATSDRRISLQAAHR